MRALNSDFKLSSRGEGDEKAEESAARPTYGKQKWLEWGIVRAPLRHIRLTR
jgi:hypothetical protein